MRPRTRTSVRLDEAAPDLITLAPQYSFAAHGVYLTILKSTIDSKPSIHNIALAGTYGAGKSSILGELAQQYPKRVVEVSLLTLGAKEDARSGAQEGSPPAPATNAAAYSKTNRIQKEIVKQLLYKQKPTKAPGSRFHRIVGHNRWVELGVAAAVGAAVVLLGLLAGLDVVTSPVFSITFTDRPHFVGVIALFLTVAGLAGILTALVRAFIRGRVAIDKVTAGPATITLPSRSASYFDEYLDEIIYFFETNRKLDIVIIEDLDRFNDPNIYESLHSLNGILNAANQLGGRDVRFIYAVRDSVFEKLGRDELEGTTDEARAEVIRANRTKFFELVIPVVPFITHRNARDLMSRELADRGHQVSKDLIDLAARHLADMRLIHNIINEYEVFKHRLLDVPVSVPELDADRLFAIVLFKNAHMSDFENIRHGSSTLDTLWTIARDLIRINGDRLREETRLLRGRQRRQEETHDFAAALTSALVNRINALANAPGSGLASATLSHQGVAVSEEEMKSPDFWRKFVQDGAALTVDAHLSGYYANTQAMQLSAATIETLTGMSIDMDAFTATAAPRAQREIEAKEEEISALSRMTWVDLAGAVGYSLQTEQSPEGWNFARWAESLLPSQLAADLVLHGYITSYFPLHVSSFYGTVVRPRAMTYVMRFVDRRTADPDFHLDPQDVESIIWSEGHSVLSEKSMLNVSIIDHLLGLRIEDAKTVIAALVGNPAVDDFVDRFLESGTYTSKFIALLTPQWDEVFSHLMATSAVSGLDQLRLLDVAIAHREPRRRYVLPTELKQRIEAGYRDLPSLATDATFDGATTTAKFIQEVGAVLSTLEGLPDAAIEELRASRSYDVNQANLEVLTGDSDLSLDALASVEPLMVNIVAESARAYLEACQQSEETSYSVTAAALLETFLTAAGSTDDEACAGIIEMAHADCKVDQIDSVPEPMWGPLFRYGHVEVSFENVAAYREYWNEIDDDIAVALATVDSLAPPANADEDDRAEVALSIVNSPSHKLDARKRAAIATSLNPGILTTSDVRPRAGRLIGELIDAGLIADDEEAFSSRLMVDWDTQAFAITHSKNFTDLVSPTTLDRRYIPYLLADDALSAAHLPVARALPAYANLPTAVHQAYAERALKGGYKPAISSIQRSRNGGISVDLTLRLLAEFRSGISGEDLRDVVRSLGSPWSKLADPGYGRSTPIPHSAHAQIVLDDLRSAGVVKTITRDGDMLHVTRRAK